MKNTTENKNKPCTIHNVSVSCCYDCKNFGYEPPAHDQPYPEFWCSKKYWDGVEKTDDLLKPIDCKDFERKSN